MTDLERRKSELERELAQVNEALAGEALKARQAEFWRGRYIVACLDLRADSYQERTDANVIVCCGVHGALAHAEGSGLHARGVAGQAAQEATTLVTGWRPFDAQSTAVDVQRVRRWFEERGASVRFVASARWVNAIREFTTLLGQLCDRIEP